MCICVYARVGVYACIRELRGGVYSQDVVQNAGFFIVIHVRDSEREVGCAAAKLVGPGRGVCVCAGVCVCVKERRERESSSEFKRGA